ncbi:MAG: SRPBCC family protein [Bacteroidota bacterium]|nr:SRPBCC family protein [Bacteroidota bacterium]
MKAVKVIIIALIVTVGLVLVVAAFLPKKANYEKTLIIMSSENTIFNQVNTLKNWEKWSPFKCDDMKTEYEGPNSGVDAKQIWESKEMGNGTLTISESVPFSSIKTFIDFGKQGTARGNWSFIKTDTGVEVTWAIAMNDLKWPVERIKGLMLSTMMKPYYTKGLQNLKDTCEALPDYSGVKEIITKVITSYSIKDSCIISDIGVKMGEIYGKLYKFIMKNKLEMNGPPYCIYHTWNPESYIHLEAAIPVFNTIGDKGEIKISGIKKVKAIEYMHNGDYDNMEKSHNLLATYIYNCGFEMAGAPWEEYITDPSKETDPEKWQTRIVYPIK